MPHYSHWHYLLGYSIVLTSHNWPVMLAVAASLVSAWKLYQRPNRKNVQRFYGWMLLVLAYEYAKHLGEELARPVSFLFTADWAWLVPAGSFLVAVVPVPLLVMSALALLLSALWLPQPSTAGSVDIVGEVHADA